MSRKFFSIFAVCIGLAILSTLFFLITQTHAASGPYGDFYYSSSSCTITGWICDNTQGDFGTKEITAAFFVDKDYNYSTHTGNFMHISASNAIWGTVNSQGITANSAKGGAIGPSNSYCGSNTNYAHWFQFKLPGNSADNISFNPNTSHTYYVHAIETGTSNPVIINHAFACSGSSSTTTPTKSPTGASTTPSAAPTTGNVSIQMDSIGLDDNANPLHPTRQLTLYFYPATDTSFQQKPQIFSGTVSYNQTTGFFTNAAFPLPGLTAGQYLVLARSLQGTLLAQVGSGDGTGPITITTTGGANTIVDTQSQNADNPNAATKVPLLLMGDLITSDPSFNSVDSLDYSVVKDCFGATATSQSDACKQHTGIIDATTHVLLPDMNDDGVVDGVDYTIMLRNFHRSVVGIQKDPASN